MIWGYGSGVGLGFRPTGAVASLGSVAPLTADLFYVPIYGQSLSLGSDPVSNGSVVSAASATHYMYAEGVRVHYNTLGSGANENSPVDPDNFGTPIALAEEAGIAVGSQFGETLASGMGAKMTTRSLFCSTGRGAYPAADLQRDVATFVDQNHYCNTYAGMLYAARWAADQGWSVLIPAFVWKQGEADAATSTDPAVWKTQVAAIRDDLRLDAASLLGVSTSSVPLLTDQVSFRQDSQDYGPIAVAAIEMHRAGDAVVVGPMYDAEFAASNDVHLSSAGYREHGERWGVVMQELITNRDWDPCHIKNAVRTGTTITLTVHVPVGPLVKDTTTFAARSFTDDGFEYSGANITAVTITETSADSNTATIEITLDADASGTLRYAYENASSNVSNAVGGHIRDSSAVVSENSGKNLWNWLCIDEWSL